MRRMGLRRVTALAARKLGRLIDQSVASGRPRPQGTSADANPEDLSGEEFHLVIARALNNFRAAAWRCPAPVCRRAKACADPRLPCLAAIAPPREGEEDYALYVLRNLLENLPQEEGEQDEVSGRISSACRPQPQDDGPRSFRARPDRRTKTISRPGASTCP
jgi:hypothetical protein